MAGVSGTRVSIVAGGFRQHMWPDGQAEARGRALLQAEHQLFALPKVLGSKRKSRSSNASLRAKRSNPEIRRGTGLLRRFSPHNDEPADEATLPSYGSRP